MVIYDLQCDQNHEFEAWVKSSEDLASQQASGMLVCPVCESEIVRKKVTSVKVARKSNSLSLAAKVEQEAAQDVAAGPHQGVPAQTYEHAQKLLGQVHRYVDQNFIDVGNKFADEALKMHRGEKDADNIRGVASKSDLNRLEREGVSALSLPPKPVEKDKLN